MKLKKLLGVDLLPKDFSKEQVNTLSLAIHKISIKRASAVILFMIVFELVLITIYDLPRLNMGGSEASAILPYFILHITIMLISIVSIILLRYIQNKMNDEQKIKAYDYLTPIISGLIMICLAIICALDQRTSGSIGVYAINTVIVGILILLKPPRNIIVFSIPYSIFLAGLLIFQTDQSLLINNLINGSIFFICILLASSFFYYNTYNSILRGILLEEANNKLEKLSNIDPLTNLYNRRYLDMIIIRELNYMKRYKETSVILLLDIDDFKKVNDTHGHPVGDVVLKEVATILSECIRESDLPIRWGGEEFMLLMFKCNVDQILPVANRILENVREYTFAKEQNLNIKVTISIGVSQINGYTQEDFQKSYEKADEALYLAKNSGKDQVKF